MTRPWEERYKDIVKEFPMVENISWGSAFREDTNLFASLLKDVIKAEGRGSTPGKRPPLGKKEASKQLAVVARMDYSDLDFYETFKALCSNKTVREIGKQTGLGKSSIYQLLNKQRYPSFSTMEKIALGFDKKPEFFLEYRIAFILLNMDSFLQSYPEAATNWFLKINESSNKLIRIK